MDRWAWAELVAVAAATVGVAAVLLVWAARWLNAREDRGVAVRCSTYFAVILAPVALEAGVTVVGLRLLGAL